MKTQTNARFIPLEEYPTTKNAKIIIEHTDTGLTAYSLISYECIPAVYYNFKDYISPELTISIRQSDLTATTRKHIYAFIRQLIPEQAQEIINTLRKLFSSPPTFPDRFTGELIYETNFLIYLE